MINYTQQYIEREKMEDIIELSQIYGDDLKYSVNEFTLIKYLARDLGIANRIINHDDTYSDPDIDIKWFNRYDEENYGKCQSDPGYIQVREEAKDILTKKYIEYDKKFAQKANVKVKK